MKKGYKYHIFISYPRFDDNWTRWTRDNLVGALRSLLMPQLGKVEIYIDESIESGTSWPKDIAKGLSQSQLLLAVLSRGYFSRDWCRLEMALMYHREQLAKLRTRENPKGLIIPIVIDDGDCFPNEIKEMHPKKMHKFANPFIGRETKEQMELAEFLRINVCPIIDEALKRVPPYDPNWETIAHDQFEDKFRIKIQEQSSVPSIKLSNLS